MQLKKYDKQIRDLRFFWLIFSAIFFWIFFYKFFINLSFWENFFSDVKIFLTNDLNILYFFYLWFIFLLLSLIYPKILFPFYKIWMKFWMIVWFINTKIIIWFLFFCIFVPIWFIWKVLWKNFLEKSIDKTRETYFDKTSSEKHSFDDQF